MPVDNQSAQRLHLNGLKNKLKDLEKDCQMREEELLRMRERTNLQAQESLKRDIEKSYNVLKYVKKEANYSSPEYSELIRAV